ncbi:MAG: ATP-binding cassette domain-containing protein [Candidatus Avilachnospira sp.]|jgi:ABC-2 type transport system ATP-binding protein
MIEISGLSKKYGSSYALKDLSLNISDGLIYGFLGPNGAGKSTTMNIITGYISATCGSVSVNGHDILAEPEEAKACIGYLPETPPLYPEMTVYEYLRFAAELKKIKRKDIKTQVESVMEMVELKEVKDKLIRNLSKGFKQRTGMAQALLGDPDIIILDEPTVGLDPKQIIEIRDLIRSLKGKHTVILSSHILSEVSAVCDRILILSRGRLAAEGTPDELESMMHGDRELELTVRGDREAVNHVLSEIEGIESFEIKENGEKKSEDELDVTVRQREGSDIRDILSLKLAERGVPVYKLKINEKSLEDIFLELTEEQEVSL